MRVDNTKVYITVDGGGATLSTTRLLVSQYPNVVITGGITRQYNQNNITFTNTTGDYFGTYSTPRTGTLTWDETNAVDGGIAVVYYQNYALDIPTTIFTLGNFDDTEINKLYLERDSEGNITCNIVNNLEGGSTFETAPVITVT